MTQELLPCPFCGGEAHPVWHTLENTWGVHCLKCTAQLYYIGLSADEAIAAWNTRAQSGNWQETLNDIARLEADNAALRAGEGG